MALIRPATVLSFLLFIALGCLLVSVLSAPIVKQIAIATNDDVRFGVFGYCKWLKNVEECTGITLGYNVGSLSEPQDFTLPSNARLTLTNLLIIHPISALLVLVLLILTIASHFYGPGHSPGYLLFLVFFSIFTCVVAILAFLVDILLFVPHLAVGGYVVIGAPVCLAIVVIGLCATRRRVVGKADRKRRIAESANTNNHLGNIEAHSNGAFGTGHSTAADSSNYRENSPVDKLPEFATFEVGKPENDGPGLDETGERIPLNPRHQSPPPGMGMHQIPMDNSSGDYNYPRQPPIPPSHMSNQYNAGPLPQNHRLPLRSPSNNGSGAFSPPPIVPQYAPSRFGPGPNVPRGPAGRPYREKQSPQPGFGARRIPTTVPPQNDSSIGDPVRDLINPGVAGPYNRNGPRQDGFDDPSRYGRSPPMASRGPSPGVQRFASNRGQSPQHQSGRYYQDPPMPPPDDSRLVRMGDMGSGPGWRNQRQGTQHQQNQLGVADYQSDDDSRIDAESRGQPSREDFIATALAPGPSSSAGRVGEQEHPGTQEHVDDTSHDGRVVSYLSEDGKNYIPPRAQWQQDDTQHMAEGAVQDPQSSNTTSQEPLSLRSDEQVADSASTNTPAPIVPSKPPPGTYYEDVDPKFAGNSYDAMAPNNDFNGGMPTSYNAGYNTRVESPRPPGGRATPNQPNYHAYTHNYNPNLAHRPNGGQQYVPYAPGRGDYGPPPPQSPAFSEQTNFTSISQRPVNPRYQSPSNQHSQGRLPQRNVPILSGNPDFELPTISHGRGGRGRAPAPGLGADKGGRYPLPPPNMPR